MLVSRIIEEKLRKSLEIDYLKLEDESYKHVGHIGAREGGESHFKLIIVAKEFEGLSRVRRHQLIYDILREEMAGPVHALSIAAYAPGEFKND